MRGRSTLIAFFNRRYVALWHHVQCPSLCLHLAAADSFGRLYLPGDFQYHCSKSRLLFPEHTQRKSQPGPVGRGYQQKMAPDHLPLRHYGALTDYFPPQTRLPLNFDRQMFVLPCRFRRMIISWRVSHTQTDPHHSLPPHAQ